MQKWYLATKKDRYRNFIVLRLPSYSNSPQDELSESYKDYVAANPELSSILADFLQALFIQKPDNVFDFARSFFQPFAPDAPHLPSHPTTLYPTNTLQPSSSAISDTAATTSGQDTLSSTQQDQTPSQDIPTGPDTTTTTLEPHTI